MFGKDLTHAGAEAGKMLEDEVRKFLLSGFPNLRSHLSLRSRKKFVWKMVGWRILRLRRIILTLNLSGLSPTDVENIQRLANQRACKLLSHDEIFRGLSIRTEINTKGEKE